jgi:predicted homoserine dehydrogenase-like protein
MMFSPYDVALLKREERGEPIRVGLVGSGNLAKMIANHLVTPPPPGIRLVAVANRTPARTAALLADLGLPAQEAGGATSVDDVIRRGRVAFTGGAALLAEADSVDVVIEATGSVEFALGVVLAAIAHGKHIVLANAELDSTLGPVLAERAAAAGVVYTNIDGDEPGVAMNLFRYLRSIGLRPVAAGNLKGMLDPYRNPETQKEFARQHGQNPQIVASFADGTKLAMEAAILANATGFRVGQPGMYGPSCRHVREIALLLPREQMLEHGLIDYALGAEPHTGAFVVVFEPNPARQQSLAYLKMGSGPFYVFYTPYHLPHMQAVASIGRAVETKDATVAPRGRPVCHVVSRAKTDLPAGAILDGPGGFTCYGQIENFEPVQQAQSQGLPVALSGGCQLRRAVVKDERIRVADVDMPADSKAVALWLDSVQKYSSGWTENAVAAGTARIDL